MKPAAYLTWPRLLFTLTMYLAMLVSTRSRSSGLPLVTAAEIVSLVTSVQCVPPLAVSRTPLATLSILPSSRCLQSWCGSVKRRPHSTSMYGTHW